MPDGQLRAVIGQLRRIVGSQGGASLTDAQLLDAFVKHNDETAFEVLVWRHGTMVFNLCKRILHDIHEAEDAFQATFLVFVRKAGSIGKAEAIGSWLYKVACRVAYRAAARSAKQPRHESPDNLPAPDAADDVLWRDLRPVLDEEINRLPERYRAPFVLCYLEGHTNEEAAELLGCPKGTILSRLSRGRDKLRSRLTRRGVVLSAAWLATQLSVSAASAAVPSALVGTTVQAAIPFLAGNTAAGLVSTSVATLTEGVLHAMFITKIKLVAAAVLTLAILGTGAGSIAHWASARSATGPQTVAQNRPQQSVQPVAQESQPVAQESYFVDPTIEDPRQPDQLVAQERPRENPNPNATTVAGKVVSVAKDGKGFVVETAQGRGGDEAKKVAVTIGPKTTVSYSGVTTGGAVPTEGYAVQVSMEKDVPVSVTFHGSERAGRNPDHTGKIVAVNGNAVTLEVGGDRRERNEAVQKIELQLNERTTLIFSSIGKGGAKLAEGLGAQVWLAPGVKGNVVAKMQVRGTEPPLVNRGEPGPELMGKISAVSADGKSFTLSGAGKNRGDEDITTEVKVSDKATIVFNNVGVDGAKLAVGSQAGIWLAAGSKDTADKIMVTGAVIDRTPVVAGPISNVSKEGTTITISQPAKERGGEPITIIIKVTPQTRISYFNVGPNEARLTDGLMAQVLLVDGSKDTAAQVILSKPGAGGRR